MQTFSDTKKYAQKKIVKNHASDILWVTHKTRMKMRLAEYLERNNINIIDFAKKIGCDRSYLSDIARGKKIPSMALGRCIEHETGGEVSFSTLAGAKSEFDTQWDAITKELRAYWISLYRYSVPARIPTIDEIKALMQK